MFAWIKQRFVGCDDALKVNDNSSYLPTERDMMNARLVSYNRTFPYSPSLTNPAAVARQNAQFTEQQSERLSVQALKDLPPTFIPSEYAEPNRQGNPLLPPPVPLPRIGPQYDRVIDSGRMFCDYWSVPLLRKKYKGVPPRLEPVDSRQITAAEYAEVMKNMCKN